MRKSLFFAVFIILLSMAGLAQNGKISYQAVVRNSANQLVHDQDLDVTVGIANSETGTAVYTETHAVHSNANGLISLLIGNGTPVAGSNWDAIQWNHAWVTAVVSQGGTELATHHLPLSAVPYALYADQVDPVALANYLTANHYLTEEVQVLSISNDTIYLTGGSWVKLPAGFSGDYNDLTNKPTNVSTFNNDAGYLTKDSAVITNLQGDVTNLQGDVTTLNTNVTQLQEATRKDALCDSVEACVKGWISDSTRMVYDSLHTYYATTDALKDSLTRYVSKEKLNDTLGHYLQAGDLCDSIVKCDVIRNLRDSVQNNTENITNNTTNITNITNNITNYVTNLQGADSVLAERLAADSTNLADNYYNKTDIDDTLSRYLQAGDLCDSIVKCDVIQNMRDSIRTNASDIKSLQNADAALSARITADSTNLAGNYYNKTSIKDTLSHYLMHEEQMLSIGHDTIYLSGGSFVKLPAGFGGSYHDLVDTPTNVSAFTNDAGYLTSFTEQQMLSISNDTIYLTGGSFVKLPAGFSGNYNDLTNKPDLGQYATNEHLNDTLNNYYTQEQIRDTLNNYYTQTQIKDTLSHYLQAGDLCDSIVKCDVVRTMRDSIQINASNITDNIAALLNADSILAARILSDSVLFHQADSILMTRILNDSILTHNTDSILAVRILNDSILSHQADSVLFARIIADSTNLADNYYNKTDIDDTLSRYLQAGDLCDSIVKCDVIQNMRDSIRTNASDITSLQNADAALSARITADSTNLAGNYYNKTSIKDTLSHYLMHEEQMLSIGHDTIYLSGGSFVKLPAGFGGSYHDLVDTPTNVSAFTNDAGYLTSFTEQQMLSISNDTIYLSGGSFVKLPAGFSGNYNDLTNKPDLGQYATNEHLNDTLNNYYTQTQIKDTLSHYLQAGDLCDSIVKCDVVRTMRDSIQINASNITDNIAALLNADSILAARILSDSVLFHQADSILMTRILNDSILTHNTDSILAVRILNDSILSHQADSVLFARIIADSTNLADNYYNKTDIDDTLSHYLQAGDLCDSIVKCDVIQNMRDSIGTNASDITSLQNADAALSARITADSTNLAGNYYNKTSIKDTLSHYLMHEEQMLSIGHDTIYLSGGSFVKLPAGFGGSYHDLVDTPTNVSAFTNDAGYLTSFTEQQMLSISNDTIYLTGGSFVKLPAGFSGNYNDLTNKPDLGQYATNEHLNDTLNNYYTQGQIRDTLNNYYTQTQIKDTLSHYLQTGDLCDSIVKCDIVRTLRDSIQIMFDSIGSMHDSIFVNTTNITNNTENITTITNNVNNITTDIHALDSVISARIIRDSTELSNRMDTLLTHVCDSVEACVKGWISDSTRMIVDSLGAYYDTTLMKKAIHDTADVLRGMMTDAANDVKITIQKNGGDVGHFTLNQATDQAINILVPTTVAEMTDASNYVTHTQLNDTLGAYYDTTAVRTVIHDSLGNYLTINGLCDSVKKCDVIKDMQTDITKLQTADNNLSTRIQNDSTNLKDHYYTKTQVDSATNKVRNDICDSATHCMERALANPNSAINNAVDSIAENIAGHAIHDTLVHNVKFTNKGDSLFLKRGGIVDTVKFPAAKMIQDSLEKYVRKTAVRDSVNHAVADALADGSSIINHAVDTIVLNIVNDTLQAYYDSTRVQSIIHDSIESNVHDGKLAVITYGATKLDTIQKFTANQAGNDTLDLSRYALMDTLHDYYATKAALAESVHKIDSLAGVTSRDSVRLKNHYYTKDEIDTKLHDTTKYALRTALADAARDIRATLNTQVTQLQNNIDSTSQHVRKALRDTARNIRNDICDSATHCIERALANPNSAINNAVDSIAENIAGHAIHDTLVHNVQFTNKGDSLFLRRGGIVDTVKLPAAKMIQDSLEKYVLKTAVRDSITNNVNLTVKNDSLFLTHGNDIDTVPAGKMIKDSIESRVHDGKLAVITHGATKLDTIQKFTANQSGNDTLDLSRYALMDTLHDYYATKTALAESVHKIDSLAGVTSRDSVRLKEHYYTKDEIDTKLHDTTKYALRTALADTARDIRATLNTQVTQLQNNIDSTSQHVRKALRDTARNIRNDICDSATHCIERALANPNSAINNAVDSIAENIAGHAIQDTLVHNVKFTNKGDSLFLKRGGIVDTVKFPAAKMIQDSLEKYVLKTAVRDSITNNVNLTVKNDSLFLTHGNDIDTVPAGKMIKDSIESRVHDGKLAVITHGATKLDTIQKFTANQSGNDTLDLSRYALMDTLHDYYAAKASLRDSMHKVDTRIKTDSLEVRGLYIEAAKTLDSLAHVTYRDSIKLKTNYYTRNQVDSTADAVRSEIGNGKLTIQYGTNDPVTFNANQKTDTSIVIPVPTAPNDNLITIQMNGQKVDDFTLNQSTDKTINLQNVAIDTAANTFSGKNTFTDTNYVEKNGFSFDDPNKTTASNCQVMVNACDLLAVFDSLMKRMDSISNALAETKRELEEVKSTTMPALQLTSDKPSEIKAGEGETVNITYTANLLRTDGEFTYAWYVNGTLQNGETNNTLVYSTSNAGTYKALCVATSVSNPNIVLKDSLTNTICIKPSMNYAFVGDDQSADYGKIQITSSTATSATWKDENDAVIGTWNEDFTDVLHSGEYTVVLTSEDCDSNLIVKIPALRLSSDPNIQTDTCIKDELLVVYETTLKLTDATFTYKWFVNGEELTGRTNDSLHYTINESGTYKVLCKATASADLILKDSLTYTISVKPIMNYTVIGGDSANFGKIRIDNCTATSAKWYDEDENEIGEWKSGYTSILPVGEYTVKLSSSTDGCDSTLTIEVNASPLCPVSSANTNEGSTSIGGKDFVTTVQDIEGNEYNVVDIGGVCWTRENMRATKYYKEGDNIDIEYNPYGNRNCYKAYYTDPYTDVTNGGYLYNWTAATGDAVNTIPNEDQSAYTRGICPEGWHLPSVVDVSGLLAFEEASQNTGKLAGSLPEEETWNPNCQSGSTPCNHDYEYRNSSGFSAINTGIYDLDSEYDYVSGKAYFWTSFNYGTYSVPFGINKNSSTAIFGTISKKWNEYSVRCVRGPELSISSNPESTTISLCGVTAVPITYSVSILNADPNEFSYSWSVYQNGSSTAISTGTGTQHTVNYTTSGDYTVSCTATHGDTTLITTYKVKAGCVHADLCASELTVTVHATDGNPVSIDWGDGETDDNVTPMQTAHTYHDYGESRSYEITVSNSNGDTETTPVTVSKSHFPCTVSQKFINEIGSTTVIDSVKDHEGNKYEVVQIGTQCWLRENMRATTSPSTGTYIVYAPTSGNDNTVRHSYTSKIAHWYNNDSTTYAPKGYGLLYNWCAAVDTFRTGTGYGIEKATGNNNADADRWYCTYSGHRRGICPKGWHIPSNDEWTQMETVVNDGTPQFEDPSHENGWRGTHAGKLATSCDWTNNNQITSIQEQYSPGDYDFADRNSSGFSALPAGHFADNHFEQAGPAAPDAQDLFTDITFWSEPYEPGSAFGEDTHCCAFTRTIRCNSQGVFYTNYDKANGYSVRCVRDTVYSQALVNPCPTLGKVMVEPTPSTEGSVDISSTLSNFTSDEVVDLGFLWTIDPNWTNEVDTLRVNLPTTNTDYQFIQGKTGLVDNVPYYFRAFVKVNSTECTEDVILGDTAKFVFQNSSFAIMVSSDSVCAGNVVTLTAPSGGTNYRWSTGEEGSSLNSIQVTQYGTTTKAYYVTVTTGDVDQTIGTTVTTALEPVTIYADSVAENTLGFYLRDNIAEANYVWNLNGTGLSDGGNISGSNTNHLTVNTGNNGFTAAMTSTDYYGVSVTLGNCTVKDSVPVKWVASAVRNCGAATVEDHEGNVYNVVSIGTQCWTRENMRAVTSPRTGTYLIYHETQNSDINYHDFASYSGKSAAWFKNDSTRFFSKNYGVLYNWNAAMDVYNPSYGEKSLNRSASTFPRIYALENRGVCPKHWHVPSDKEWNIMENFVSDGVVPVNPNSDIWGSRGVHAVKLAGGNDWISNSDGPGDYNDMSRNYSGLTLLPSSTHYDNVPNNFIYLWTSSIYNAYVGYSTSYDSYSWSRKLYYLNAEVTRDARQSARDGAVRCVKDADIESEDLVIKVVYYRNYAHTNGGIGFEIKQYGQYTAEDVDNNNITIECYRLSGTSTLNLIQENPITSLENDIFEGVFSGLSSSTKYYFRAKVRILGNDEPFYSNWATFTVYP